MKKMLIALLICMGSMVHALAYLELGNDGGVIAAGYKEQIAVLQRSISELKSERRYADRSDYARLSVQIANKYKNIVALRERIQKLI